MSRIAKTPIELPSGVDISIKDSEVKVKGPKGNLSLQLHSNVNLEQEEKTIVVKPASDSDIPMAGTFQAFRSRRQVRRNWWSGVVTSSRSARLLRKSGRSVHRSLTRARVFGIQTNAWCAKRPRKPDVR